LGDLCDEIHLGIDQELERFDGSQIQLLLCLGDALAQPLHELGKWNV
jgi:hypothetical protein